MIGRSPVATHGIVYTDKDINPVCNAYIRLKYGTKETIEEFLSRDRIHITSLVLIDFCQNQTSEITHFSIKWYESYLHLRKFFVMEK